MSASLVSVLKASRTPALLRPVTHPSAPSTMSVSSSPPPPLPPPKPGKSSSPTCTNPTLEMLASSAIRHMPRVSTRSLDGAPAATVLRPLRAGMGIHPAAMAVTSLLPLPIAAAERSRSGPLPNTDDVSSRTVTRRSVLGCSSPVTAARDVPSPHRARAASGCVISRLSAAARMYPPRAASPATAGCLQVSVRRSSAWTSCRYCLEEKSSPPRMYMTPSWCTAEWSLRCDGGIPRVATALHVTCAGSLRSATCTAVDVYVAEPPVWSQTLPPHTHICASPSMTAVCLLRRTGRSPETSG
mmetsp:Transcript_14610/g.35719  ORF Transcript_14610/g.35719 Transcript_14610/m.35719 type:complete len:299 (-) Transcript_14610:1361-2257(-)